MANTTSAGSVICDVRPNLEPMDPISYFGLAVVIAVVITALVCRRRLACKKRVSYGTLLIGAFSAGAVAYVCAFIYIGGGEALDSAVLERPKADARPWRCPARHSRHRRAIRLGGPGGRCVPSAEAGECKTPGLTKQMHRTRRWGFCSIFHTPGAGSVICGVLWLVPLNFKAFHLGIGAELL